MRILVDENSPVQLVMVLSHLLPKHKVDHVTTIGWSGKKDIPLLADAAGKGYEVFLTRDGRQLENPDETRAIMRAGIHHVRYTQTVNGLVGVGLSMGAVAAAMPLIMDALQVADGQRLIRIARLDHNPQARFEMTDPRKSKPKYWRT
jgi:PIN like domain